jgi:hypothetical protein
MTDEVRIVVAFMNGYRAALDLCPPGDPRGEQLLATIRQAAAIAEQLREITGQAMAIARFGRTPATTTEQPC